MFDKRVHVQVGIGPQTPRWRPRDLPTQPQNSRINGAFVSYSVTLQPLCKTEVEETEQDIYVLLVIFGGC